MREDAAACLARWGIAPDIADAAGLFDVDNANTVYSEFEPLPAIVIPYYTAAGDLLTFHRDGADLPFCRVRYLADPPGKSFVKTKPLRYAQPARSGTPIYFPPLPDWQAISQDVQTRVLITEGEAKALAGTAAGWPVIGIGGVWNWTNGGEDLARELAAWRWRGRDVAIVFDSDAALNPQVLAAEARLVDVLQRQYGASCRIVRLPPGGKGEKQGLDDFLLSHGPDALDALIAQAQPLTGLDAKVLELNRTCAWIEKEAMIWDFEERDWIRKDSFLNGSRFSTLRHITVGGSSRAPKEVQVSAAWLRHPYAQRYGQILFRPGEGQVVTAENGRPALNMWTGWPDSEPGDVQPFLELSDFLFQHVEPEDRDFALKLWAYKVQNPHEKPSIAVVLLGLQGSGKSLYGDIMKRVFDPYSTVQSPRSFTGQFQGWMEKALLCVVNEAKGEDLEEASEELKTLISDKQRGMDEKFRPQRQIQTYFQFIISANKRAVGSFSQDDRRMFVVNCPPKREESFYKGRIVPWMMNGGPGHLRHYLLNYDLQGWQPPASAPMTAEKALAGEEGLTAVQRLAKQMQQSNEAAVARWIGDSVKWAEMTLASNMVQQHSAARATLEAAQRLSVRPWYEPRELAQIFPHLIATQTGSRYNRSTPPGQLSRELREAGIPYLVCADDPRGFWWDGDYRQFLVVSDFERWGHARLTQKEFDAYMAEWPSYATLRAQERRGA